MAKIAITGASGFIGGFVCRTAAMQGHDVVALSRTDRSLPTGYEDSQALEQAFTGVDAVIHLAARAHRGGKDADFECNVRAADAVAKAAQASGVARLVLVSSIGVNGNVTHGKAFTEQDPPEPAEPYARSKLLAEQRVRAVLEGSSTQWTVVRPPLVYGPRAPGNFGRLVRAVAKGIPLPVAGVRNRRSLVGVQNLSDALLLCALAPAAANQLFLIADGEDLSTPEIVQAIAQGVGVRPRMWDFPPSLLTAVAAIAGRRRIAESLCESLQVDASRIRNVLGWRPRNGTTDGISQAAASWSRP